MNSIDSELLVWIVAASMFLNLVQLYASYRFSRMYRTERRTREACELKLAQYSAGTPPQTSQAPLHPIWSIAHVVVLVAGLSVILLLTADNPDKTEIQSLLWFLVLSVGATQLGPRQFRILMRAGE